MIALDHKQVNSYYGRASAYYQRRRFREALADIEKYQPLGGEPDPKLLDTLRRLTGSLSPGD